MWVPSLDREDPLEGEIATHFSILAWEIPWTEEPGSYSPWDHKESNVTECTHTHTHISVWPPFMASEALGTDLPSAIAIS